MYSVIILQTPCYYDDIRDSSVHDIKITSNLYYLDDTHFKFGVHNCDRKQVER